ncbi:MFS transporter [Sphingomonas sp. 36D10-4-7]|uniref:MFS transporter n=1 Tax=Sphingomonas corticis TaxID=2722791 RepID=A0ABX1CUE7_9SPHN|nr:MFS transporter [Sphingomonas corticis]
MAAVSLAMAVYLPRHYASHLGIDLALVGTAFFIVRFIDIPVEALLGWGMDRTRSRLGRYRLWTLIGTPLFMLGVYFVFMPPAGIDRTYLIAWLLVMYLGNSIMMLSHLAWASTLAPRYDERSKLFGLVTAVGVLGAAAVIAISIVNDARDLPDSTNVPAMGAFALVATPLAIGLMLWRTPERVAPEIAGHKFGPRDYLALLARPSFARLILADLCLSLGPGWMAAIYLFFFTDSRGFTTGQASVLLATYILAGIVGAPVMGRVAVRISKHRTVIVACVVYSLVLASFMLLPRGNLPAFVCALFLAGFMAASFNATTRAMTADIADEVRLDHGRERAGLLYAMTTMTNKITGALSIGLTFFVLSRVGYVATEGATNTPEAISHLEIVFLTGPIVFVMLGAFCMIGYGLTAERHAEIRRQLDERDAQYDEAAVIETLTSEARAVAP